MKTLSQSRTVRFNLLMAAIEASVAGMYMFEPVLAPMHFALISFALGLVHSVGGVYLRTITSTPIK